MDTPLLRLDNVSKSFGVVRALKGISFSLRPGEVHALLGENGAGKSTLIKLITGAHQPDDGNIEIAGQVVHRLNPASARALGIAAIYQQPALFSDLSVAENIALGLEKPNPARRVRCVLFGITPADSGRILLDGKPLEIRSPREAVEAGIGYLPEDRRRHGVILEMSVAANITLGILSRLFPASWLRFGAERQLAEGFCRDLAVKTPSVESPVSALSGGNQQKVALARWLATTPKLLILDEPTQGVDVGAKVEIHNLIRRLARNGLAVLMISSDLPEVIGMSDRIAVMRGGTIIAMFNGVRATAHEVMAAALGGAGNKLTVWP